MKNQNNYKKDIEKQKESLKDKIWRHKGKIALTLALFVALGIGGCHIINSRNNNVDDVLDDSKELIGDNSIVDNKNKVIGNGQLEDVVDVLDDVEDLDGEILPDDDLIHGTTDSVDTPVDNVNKRPNESTKPIDTVVPTIPNQKEDEPSLDNKHEHDYIVSRREHIPYGEGKHVERILWKCVDGDSTKTTFGAISDCSWVLTGKDDTYEYWTCPVCGQTKKVKHVLIGTKDGNGNITYECVNDGCDYSYVGTYTPENGNDNNNNNNNNNNNSGTNGGDDNVNNPIKPDTPDTPDNPDLPDTPDNPDVPENPDNPDVPENPDNPDVPDNPDNPDVPENPDNPDVPDNPDNPDVPENPEEPGENDEIRDDLTSGTGDGDGFVGGDSDIDDDFGDEEAYELEQLYSIREELVQSQEIQEVQEDTPSYAYDYQTNTLRLSK